MEAQTLATHSQCATLEKLPSRICEGGPLFTLGKVIFEAGTWEVIPSSLLLRALELHSCGIYGDLDDYEISNNFYNVGQFERHSLGERVYRGCIYSRWNPTDYHSFTVMTHWATELFTSVSAANR